MTEIRAGAPAKNRLDPALGYVIVTMAFVAALVFGLKWLRRDVEFCRSVFRGLVNGSASVEQHIDWEHLRGLNVDVGATYTKLSTPLDRTQYREKFVEAFSKGFQLTGARSSSFVNWRVADRQADTITVAADYPSKKKTLLFVIPSVGTKRIEAIRWLGQEHMKAEPCCGEKS